MYHLISAWRRCLRSSTTVNDSASQPPHVTSYHRHLSKVVTTFFLSQCCLCVETRCSPVARPSTQMRILPSTDLFSGSLVVGYQTLLFFTGWNQWSSAGCKCHSGGIAMFSGKSLKPTFKSYLPPLQVSNAIWLTLGSPLCVPCVTTVSLW